MKTFWDGFEKQAAKKEDKHYVRRALLGTPISAAIGAKKGKKMKAFGETYMHAAKESLKGTGVGGAGGALAGLLASAITKGKIKPQHGAAFGGMTGAGAGSVAGNLKGQFDPKATRLHQRYSK